MSEARPTSKTETIVQIEVAKAHCKENRECYGGCGFCFLLMLVIFLSTCWGMIAPTQYGLLRNGISGKVDLDTVYTGGRHYIGWGHEFILFPRRLETMRPSVMARTGPGENDQDSGGQPVLLDVSFQYKFEESNIPRLYRTYGLGYESSYMRFAQQAITNVAQEFTPFAFWQTRSLVEERIREAVNATIVEEGFAHVESLQLVSVSFQENYEQTITNIQLQEQLRVTRQYELLATSVEMEIAVLQAQTTAQINIINAEASRESAVIINRANTDALLREQKAKANMYRQIRQHLNWTQAEFLDYVRMKSLNKQEPARVKVGMDAVGAVPTHAGPDVPTASEEGSGGFYY